MRTTVKIAATACMLWLLSVPLAAFEVQSSLSGRVTDVRSGDVIVVEDIPIRLNGVAAPPILQAMGGDAKAFMQWLVLDKDLRCDLNGEQSRGRFIAICYLDDIDIARTLIREGYARDCPRFSGGRYARDEAEAKPSGIQDLYPLPDYCGVSL